MTFVLEKCGTTCQKKVELLKKLHFIVRALNKPDISPREEIFVVCKKFSKELTDNFFTIIDSGTGLFVNESSFTQQKDNDPSIKHFGTMYINFCGYRPYSSAISETFETNINTHIQFYRGYSYYSIKDNILTWINE